MTIREAAERLARCVPPDAVHEGVYASMDEMAEDAVPVACALLRQLAENPADSEMAVDEVWLRSVGFEQHHGTTCWYSRMMSLVMVNGRTLQIGTSATGWRVITDAATRGHLRRLAKALGITLEEAK